MGMHSHLCIVSSSQFHLASMDVVEVPHVVPHLARFLPAIRDSGLPFALIIVLIIPGSPLIAIAATYATDQVWLTPWRLRLLTAPDSPITRTCSTRMWH